MSARELRWLALAAACVLASAIAVVWSKAQSRMLFVELQQRRAVLEREIMEWGRLQLELASTGSLEDVRRAAERRLKMRPPAPEQIVVVE